MNGLTSRQAAFLEAFRTCGCISRAASAAGCDRSLHYGALRTSEAYREAFADAREEATDLLESEARRRAMHGLRVYRFTKDGTPILHPENGQPYFDLVYSDKLMELLLRAYRPGTFAKFIRQEVSGPEGGPVEHSLRQLALLDEAACNQLCDALEAASADDATPATIEA